MIKFCQTACFLWVALSAPIVWNKFSGKRHIFRHHLLVNWRHLKIGSSWLLRWVVEPKSAALNHWAFGLVHGHVILVPERWVLLFYLKLLHELGHLKLLKFNGLFFGPCRLLSFQLRLYCFHLFRRGLHQGLNYFFTSFVPNGLVAARLGDQLLGVLNIVLLSNNVVYFYNVFLLFDAFVALMCIDLLDTGLWIHKLGVLRAHLENLEWAQHLSIREHKQLVGDLSLDGLKLLFLYWIWIVHFNVSHLAIIIWRSLSILVKFNHFPLKILVRPKISFNVARPRNVGCGGHFNFNVLSCLFFKYLTVFVKVFV